MKEQHKHRRATNQKKLIWTSHGISRGFHPTVKCWSGACIRIKKHRWLCGMWNNVFFLWICISGCYKTIENTVSSWAELDLTLQPASTKQNYMNIRCTFFQLCCFKDFIFLQNHNLTHTSLLHISTVLGVQIVLRDLEGLPEIRDLKDHTHPSKWGGQDKNGWLWGLCITKVLCFYFVKAVTSVYPLWSLWL